MDVIEKNGASTTIRINQVELLSIFRALVESLEQIEDWEFHTLMGVTKDEVRALLDQFRELYK